MSIEDALDRLLRQYHELARVVERQGVLLNNIIREGVVQSVDYKAGTAVAMAHGIPTKPIKWTEPAGDIVEWTPLAPGERVMVVSPGGDLGRAFIVRGGYTDDAPQPHNEAAQKRTKIGAAVVTQSADGLLIDIDGTTFSFTKGGFAQVGGTQTHDEKNVGSTHVHGGIIPGGADTRGPH